MLLNELGAATTSYVLVLDDYHVLSDPRIHEGIEFLVTYLPSSLRLVLAGRADPPLPLARLRARGELTELRAADLRFSADEARRAADRGDRSGRRSRRRLGGLGADRGVGGRAAAGRARAARRTPRRCAAMTGTCWTTSPPRCCPASRPRSATCSCAPRRSSGFRARSATPHCRSTARPRCWPSWTGPTCSWPRSTTSALVPLPPAPARGVLGELDGRTPGGRPPPGGELVRRARPARRRRRHLLRAGAVHDAAALLDARRRGSSNAGRPRPTWRSASSSPSRRSRRNWRSRWPTRPRSAGRPGRCRTGSTSATPRSAPTPSSPDGATPAPRPSCCAGYRHVGLGVRPRRSRSPARPPRWRPRRAGATTPSP